MNTIVLNIVKKSLIGFILIGVLIDNTASAMENYPDVAELQKILSKYNLTNEMTQTEKNSLKTDIETFNVYIKEKINRNLYASIVEEQYMDFISFLWTISNCNISGFDNSKKNDKRLIRDVLLDEGIEVNNLPLSLQDRYIQNYSSKTLPIAPHDYRDVFVKYEDAVDFIKRNIQFYTERSDADQLRKWENELATIDPSYFNRDRKLIYPFTYAKGARDVGIDKLHQLGCYGQNVKVGMLDVRKYADVALRDHKELKKVLVSGSSPLLTDHSYSMLRGLAADVETIDSANVRKIHDGPSIAPLASVFHYVTNKWEHTINLKKEDEEVHLTKVSKVVEDGMLLDIILEDQEADLEIANFFRSLIEKNVNIVNVSRDLLIGDISKEAIKGFVHSGGLIVISLGNGGFKFMSTGIEMRMYNKGVSEKIAASQYPLIKFVHHNKDLQKGFVFVGALEGHKEGYFMEESSCKPGDFIAHRTICAPVGSDGYYVKVGEKKHELNATSGATVFVTGTVSLLQSAFPAVTPQDIAQILLDKATTLRNPSICGQGMLNAKSAFEVLKEKYSFN